MITCVGCGNAIISVRAVVRSLASSLALDLMDTAIRHLLMTVMWLSVTMSGVSSHTRPYVPKGKPLH